MNPNCLHGWPAVQSAPIGPAPSSVGRVVSETLIGIELAVLALAAGDRSLTAPAAAARVYVPPGIGAEAVRRVRLSPTALVLVASRATAPCGTIVPLAVWTV